MLWSGSLQAAGWGGSSENGKARSAVLCCLLLRAPAHSPPGHPNTWWSKASARLQDMLQKQLWVPDGHCSFTTADTYWVLTRCFGARVTYPAVRLIRSPDDDTQLTRGNNQTQPKRASVARGITYLLWASVSSSVKEHPTHRAWWRFGSTNTGLSGTVSSTKQTSNQ